MKKLEKYKYNELDYKAPGQRSCYVPGRVYIYNNNRGQKRGFVNGDLLLCIRKSGDCFYDFIRIKKQAETSYSGIPTYQLFAYFELLNKTNEYGGMKEAFPTMETLSKLDLVHALYKKEVLIPLFATFSKTEMENFEKKIRLQKELVSL